MNVSAVSYKSLKKKLHERFVAVKLEEGIVDQIDKPLARLRKSGQLCTVRLCEIIHAITYTQMISELINESANFVMSEVQSRSTGRTEKFKAVICKNCPSSQSLCKKQKDFALTESLYDNDRSCQVCP